MFSGWIHKNPNGVTISGVDHGGIGKILAENDEYIVIKWPSHQYWSGRGITSYASPEIAVCRKMMKAPLLGKDKTPAPYVEPVIEWELTKKRKEVKP